MQEWQIKNQISFRLLSDRAYNFYTYVINELYQKKLIKIENPYPITPKEWIEIKNNPVAGTADAKNELVMIGGFLCGTCQKYNLQLLNLLSKKINSGLRFTPIFITNGEDGEFIINKTLYCLNEQNQEFYWEFFNKIIPTIAKSKIQNTKETLNSITALSRDIMKSMSLDTAAFNTCYSFKDNYNKKNQEIRNQLNFIDLNESPIFFLNSKKLDPDGRDLDLVFEESAL
jgi:thiol-disulfide isomerase/thioredoxin